MIKLIKEADEKVKNNLKDFSEQEIRSFIDSIDFNKLSEILSDKLGINNLVITADSELEISFNYNTNFNDIFVHYESNNISEYCGVFSVLFPEVVINDFGGKLGVKSGKLYYYSAVSIAWEYKDGGSNGARLPFRMYWDGTQWIVK